MILGGEECKTPRHCAVMNLVSNVVKSHENIPGKGIPLGNVSSQLFANIYLNELDRYAKNDLGIKNYIRYCDDFVIIHGSRAFLVAQTPILLRFLHGVLRL